MRRSLRFFSSCWSSSVIVWSILIEQKVIARNASQNHAFQTVQIVKTVTAGFAGCGQQTIAGVLAKHAQQLAQGTAAHLMAPLLQPKNGSCPPVLNPTCVSASGWKEAGS